MESTRITPENPPSTGRKEKNQNIQVFVRVRPINNLETAKNAAVVVDTPGTKEVVVKERTVANITKTFTFDRVFGPRSKQVDVYKVVVSPLLSEVLLGYNCTVFAYGQTGTGKTYTMEGERTQKSGGTVECDPQAGILPRALSQLFDEVRLMNCEFTVRVSFLELYNEELFDLLAPLEGSNTKTLRLFEDSNRKGSVIIQGLEEVIVHNKQEVYAVLDRGSHQRKTAATLMNAASSRSHTIFTITVHMKESSVEGEEMLKVGKLNLVDLAGSENIGKSGAVDKRAREAGSINQSLLTLGRVISALVERTPHIPYRESKLTRLLQDSLGGKTKTSIIATVSPAVVNIEETMSTLDYAHRAKNIMNKPEVNQKLTKKEALNIYTDEIERLRRDLNATRDKSGVYMDNDNYQRTMAQIHAQHAELNEKSNKIRELEELITEKEQNEIECAKIVEEMRVDLQIKHAMLDEAIKKQDNLHKRLLNEERKAGELKYLVKYHLDAEEVLSGEASNLLCTASDSVAVIEALHGRLERKQGVEDRNRVSSLRFREEFRKGMDEIIDVVEGLREEHTISVSSIRELHDAQSMENQSMLDAFTKTVDETFAMVEVQQAELRDLLSGRMGMIVRSSETMTETIKSNLQGLNAITKEQLKTVESLFANLKQLCINVKAENQKLERSISDKFGNMSTEIKHLLSTNTKTFDRVNHLIMSMKKKFMEVNSQGQLSFETFKDNQNKYKVELNEKLGKVQKEVDYFKEAAARMNEVLQELKNGTDDQFGKSESTFRKVIGDMADACSTMGENATDSCQSIQEAKQVTNSVNSKMASFKERNVTEHANQIQGTMNKIVTVETMHIPKLTGMFQSMVDDFTESLCQSYGIVVSNKEEVERQNQYLVRDVCAGLNMNMQKMGLIKSHSSEVAKALNDSENGGKTKVLGTLDKQCDEVSNGTKKVNDMLRQAAGNVDEFWDETYLLDSPSGGTPMRRKYELPSKLSLPSPHSRVMARYRAVSKDVQHAIDDCGRDDDLDCSWSDSYFKNLVIPVAKALKEPMSPLSRRSPAPVLDMLSENTENQNPSVPSTPTGNKQLESIEESEEPKDGDRKSNATDESEVFVSPKDVQKETGRVSRKSMEKRSKNKKKKGVLKSSN